MARYAALLDVFRQVANVLRPEHGGTGTQYGEGRTVVHALNSTGADIELYSVVEPTFATNSPKVRKAAATASTDVLGVLVGYYGGSGELVEADCPDGYEAAVQIAGITPALIESAVTRGHYAKVAATDGTISGSSSSGSGAFGRILDSADVSAGATTARIALGVPGAGAGTVGASFGTPSLTLSTSNAAGASTDAIRTDATVAAFDTTAPTTSAVGDAAATGSAGKAARRDHTHGRESFATPAIAHGTSANAGVATTPIRSDATLATFDATAPVTQAFGDAAATGSADRAARRDHVHGMPANPSPSFATPAIVLGSAAAAGATGTVIRSDSTIDAFDATTPAAIGTAATGSAAKAARRDHVHATGASTPTTQAFGDTAATGSGPAAAMSDHKHGMPSDPTGGTGTTTITKASDERIASSTVLQNDDELFFSTVSGAAYVFDCDLIIDMDSNSAAVDIKLELAEDSTFRGWYWQIAPQSGGGAPVLRSVQTGQTHTFDTGHGPFVYRIMGSFIGGGGTFRLTWAQNASNSIGVIVKAGSQLRYRRLT